MRRHSLTATAIVVVAAALIAPASSAAHAVLEVTRPASGATVRSTPSEVSVRFNEPVEASFGALSVFDPAGERIATGEPVHDQPEQISVPLDGELNDGVYTVTYRVLSADSHPVSGGFTFTVGDPDQAPSVDVADLVEQAGAGPVTDAALGVARVGTYLSTALLIGSVAFLLLAWGRGSSASPRAEDAIDGRLRLLMVFGVVLGVIFTVAGIVLEAAQALGASAWDALDPDVLADALSTRFGTVWALRGLDLLALGGLIAAGLAPRPRGSLSLGVLLGALAALALAPGLAGHAGVGDDVGLSVAANAAHVLAFSVWLGGLAAILYALPAATVTVEGVAKTRMLARVVGRFSTVALAAVATLLATGAIQSILELDRLGELLDLGWGRAILVKAGLLLILIVLGALNRRSLRGIEARATDGEAPGSPGVSLRTAICFEVALIGGVLVATAVLAATAPPGDTAGPFSATSGLGPAELELTVDPARVGPNQMHLYLFDAETGAQYGRAKEVTVTAGLPDAGISGLAQDVRPSGPGHFVVRDTQLSVPGDWVLEVDVRTSAFDQYSTEVEVPVG